MTKFRQILSLLLLAQVPAIIAGSANLIVGGQDAYAGQFPHQVWIYRGRVSVSARQLCGGSILNSEWILTSASCIMAMSDNDNVEVKAGKHEVDDDSEYVQKSKVLIRLVHYNYVENDKDINPYDIGLLKLTTPLKFNNRVKPVKLPWPYIRPKGDAILTGWGSTSDSHNSNLPDALQFAKVQLLTNRNCEDALRVVNSDEKLTDLQFCSGPLDETISACIGDFGGPLIQNKNGSAIQIGIASWADYPCGDTGTPTVYTLVSAFVYWIQLRIQENQ